MALSRSPVARRHAARARGVVGCARTKTASSATWNCSWKPRLPRRSLSSEANSDPAREQEAGGSHGGAEPGPAGAGPGRGVALAAVEGDLGEAAGVGEAGAVDDLLQREDVALVDREVRRGAREREGALVAGGDVGAGGERERGDDRDAGAVLPSVEQVERPVVRRGAVDRGVGLVGDAGDGGVVGRVADGARLRAPAPAAATRAVSRSWRGLASGPVGVMGSGLLVGSGWACSGGSPAGCCTSRRFGPVDGGGRGRDRSRGCAPRWAGGRPWCR
jgi:hypothetical protein